MLIQQHNPKSSGFAPVFISFITFVLRPIALIARTIMNLLSLFIGVNISAGAPRDDAIVVIEAVEYEMRYNNKTPKEATYIGFENKIHDKHWKYFLKLKCIVSFIGFSHTNQRQYKCNWNNSESTGKFYCNCLIKCH